MVDPASDVRLPTPRHDGEVSLEHALTTRRSIREFARGALTLAEVGQLLWAAQGVTHSAGLRTAPSAGALYPLEVYLAAGEVSALTPGLYRYDPNRHMLAKTEDLDCRIELANAALCQAWIATAAAILVLAAVHQRMTDKYGSRGERYVHIESGTSTYRRSHWASEPPRLARSTIAP